MRSTSRSTGSSPACEIRLAPLTTTPNCSGTTRYCAGPAVSDSDDHVVDIGCGTGQTTRQAARTARAGRVLGIDVTRGRDRARPRASPAAEELSNVAFEHADAQVYRFPHERLDLAISRFGTMFFADPAAAFANIRGALRPTGRLVMMVWQAPSARNEWDVAICQALGVPQDSGAARFRWTGPVLARRPVGRDRGPGDHRMRSALPSPTSASRSTTARTWPPPSTGSVRLHFHQPSTEPARPRRRCECGPAAAGGARRAPQR